MRLTGGAVRRLIPAAAVAAVLVASYAAPASLASSTNNCGVKGYGYHDHGKPCPNRPFPGHGKGVIRIATQFGTTLSVTSNSGNGHQETTAPSTSMAASTTEAPGAPESSAFASKSHGHAHSKSNDRGLSRSAS